MDYEALKFWFEVVVFGFNVCLWVYVWRSNKDKATNAKIEQLERDHNAELKQLREQLAAMDTRLVRAIGQSELEPIYDRLRIIGEGVACMSGEFTAVKHQLSLIQEAILTRSGGKG